MPSKESQKSNSAEVARVKKVKKNNQILVFEKTLQKSKGWIRDLQKEVGFLKPVDAYHLLRAVLHALRDQLSINEGAHLSAQLPLLLRGVYYECWNPPKGPHKVVSKMTFLNNVVTHLGPAVRLNIDLEEGVAAVFKTINKHISEGEMKDIIHALSPTLREFVLKAQQPPLLN